MNYHLEYIGKGKAIPGLPAKSLTKAECDNLGGEKALILTGLWQKARKTKKKDKK